jgi:hypothetical protein
MRHATRITLFVQHRSDKSDIVPDSDVLNVLMRQTPLVTRNPDGSRTLVFDLPDPAAMLGQRAAPNPRLQAEQLRSQIAAMAAEARALGLPLTASLADAAELVIEAELDAMAPPRTQG